MKIDDKMIDAAIMAGYTECGSSSKPHESSRRFMRAAAAVIQKLHEEELERVLGPIDETEITAFIEDMDRGCDPRRYRVQYALGCHLEGRRALIAPEPTLEEKIHAILVRNHGGESHWSTTKEIVALLERK